MKEFDFITREIEKSLNGFKKKTDVSEAGRIVACGDGDLNVCFVFGIMSYIVILSAGLIGNGFKGALGVLKDFSLPLSMSFRLFGAIIGGVLVNELIYVGFSIMSMTVLLPVFVDVMFTLMHAVVQTYIFTLLTSMFFGEAVEVSYKKEKSKKEGKNAVATSATTKE